MTFITTTAIKNRIIIYGLSVNAEKDQEIEDENNFRPQLKRNTCVVFKVT